MKATSIDQLCINTVIAPILVVWQALPARNFPNYAAGSWGPIEADQLLQREGHAWGDSP